MKPLFCLLFAAVLLPQPSARAEETVPASERKPAAEAEGAGPLNTSWAGFPGQLRKREQDFAKTRDADRGAIVFLGDSITQFWDLGGAFPGLHTANRGVAGDTTRGMLQRLRGDVLDLHPQAVVFLGGINDLFQTPPGTPETIAANVRTLLARTAAAQPGTPVYICELLPCAKQPEPLILRVNAAVDTVLAGFPDARRVRIHSLYLDAEGGQNASLFKDGTHLKHPVGYTAWRDTLRKQLDEGGARH